MSIGALRRRILTVLALLVFFVPKTARADSVLASCDVTIVPRNDGTKAHFVLTLTYETSIQKRLNGSAYLSARRIENLEVHSLDGAPLKHELTEDRQSHDQQIDVLLPDSDANARQTAVIEFDQTPEMRYRFDKRLVNVDWGDRLSSSVEPMTLHVLGPLPEASNDLVCVGAGQDRVCTRPSKSKTLDIHFTMTGGGPHSNLSSVAAAPGLITLFLVILFGLRRRHLRATRGILPVVPEPVFGEVQTGYRAPPPIKPVAKLPKQLAPNDSRDLAFRAVSGAAIFALTLIVWITATDVPAPEWVVGTATSVAAGLVVAFILTDSVFWLFLLPFAAVGVLLFAGVIPLIVTLACGFFAYVICRSGLGERDLRVRNGVE